jgi:hypothetical protein
MKHACLVIATLAATALLASARDAGAADVIPQVKQRFAAADAAEVPDFQRHMVPLLGKLGCNGRACHGSFQGRGGFRLSLFGYDFKMDHEGLMDRIDVDAPKDSYALHKALLVEPHEGGQRIKEGTWEHNLFLRWIEGGAKPRAEDAASLVSLEVTPSEILYSAVGQTRQMKAIAVWSDGSREDVTCLCRFTSNDAAIADVTPEGKVTSGDMGDTHVVVFYDNAVIPVPVIRPVSEQFGKNYPQVAATTPIDRAIVEKLSKLGIVPSEKSDDAEFLRRVHLDVAGTLPTADEVRAFLADSSPDKRERKIDDLLETPAYAAWWTTRLCDWTGANDNALNNVNPVARQNGSTDWYNWIYERVAKNMPYDDLVEGIVVAQGRMDGESYRDYCERMSEYYHGDKDGFSQSPGLMYFWGRNNFRTNEDRAIGFAYTFMGTRIQCAQCHKHPFDIWTQEDFQQFERFFTRVNFARNGSDRDEYQKLLEEIGLKGKANNNEQRNAITKAIEEGKTVPFPEIVINEGRRTDADRKQLELARKKGEKIEPSADNARLLGGEVVNLAEVKDPREALMNWLRHDEKQLFAKALVNRVWANYFHRGIVEPTDDMSLANPPANAALLDYLAKGFVENNYDLKWLHREICNSDAYQRTWRPNDTNVADERNFSRAVPRRLPAEVAYDALQMATAGDARAKTYATELEGRALRIPGTGRNNNVQGPNYALTVFGRSVRESNCDCDRSAEASLLQVVFTRNDQDIYTMIDRRDGWLAGFKPDTKAAAESKSRKDAQEDDVADQIQRLERQIEKARKSKDEDARKLVTKLQDQLNDLRKQARDQREEAAAPPKTEKLALDAGKIAEEAYLRTLSRYPTEAEKQIAAGFVSNAADTLDGVRSLLWTLVNTKEFIVNH